MKFLKKLALISSISVLSTAPVSASLFRVDFTYGAPIEGQNATLSGFMVVDTLASGYATDIQTDLGFTDLPGWINNVSLTFTAAGSDPVTTSGAGNFDKLVWNLKGSSIGSFDINSDFEGQFDGFGFRSTDNVYAIATSNKDQQHLPSLAEFPLSSTATTPGGLPFLGLGALALYYKKLNNKKFKL